METLEAHGFFIINTYFDCNYCESNWDYLISTVMYFFINLMGEREEATVFGDVVIEGPRGVAH